MVAVLVVAVLVAAVLVAVTNLALAKQAKYYIKEWYIRYGRSENSYYRKYPRWQIYIGAEQHQEQTQEIGTQLLTG